jgi:hypothetical protein
VSSVEVEGGKGLVGDRYNGTKQRNVTVQSWSAPQEAAASLDATLWSPARPFFRLAPQTTMIGEVGVDFSQEDVATKKQQLRCPDRSAAASTHRAQPRRDNRSQTRHPRRAGLP